MSERPQVQVRLTKTQIVALRPVAEMLGVSLSKAAKQALDTGIKQLSAAPPDFGTITDDYTVWARCSADCQLQVVRPGKVQCDKCEGGEDQ